mgnify:CR=1 FL=1
MSQSHPNGVGLLEVGEAERCYVLVMELCRGDLFDRIELCGWFDEDEALHYMSQLAAGVAACQAGGVVPREPKPGACLGAPCVCWMGSGVVVWRERVGPA